MLTKDLLRVSRAGGGYSLRFAGPDDRELAAQVVGVFQGHVGQTRADLLAALDALERESGQFKLVRGFAKLLERETAFETRAAIVPERARRAAFEAAEGIGVVTDADRERALARAADSFGAEPETLAHALYADRDVRGVLVESESRWSPDDLLVQYNLSLAQTALFDATELRVRTDDPRALVSSIKWLGLMYEMRQTAEGRVVELTGPDALFRPTRRYGTRFARLLRTVARSNEWRIEATIDDRGTERMLVLTHEDPVSVPEAAPVAAVSYDSDVEREFATRFAALDLDWALEREPEVLAAGDSLMIPDFAFDYAHTDFRVFFEIMGFWTPEYVEKKLAQFGSVEECELLVAFDESLGVGEEITARDHRAIPYAGSVRVKDVRDALRRYERELVAQSAASLPNELVPDDDVVTLADLAARHGVSESAIEEKVFPDHERVGRTLVRPAVLASLQEEIEPGMSLSAAEDTLAECGLDDASATLSALGFRVKWAGLGDGTVREK